MNFLKQLKKDTSSQMKSKLHWDFRTGLLGLGAIVAGLAIGFLGVSLGGTIGTVLVLVGIAVAALGAFLAGGI